MTQVPMDLVETPSPEVTGEFYFGSYITFTYASSSVKAPMSHEEISTYHWLGF
jgi:hypothetical protein